MKIRWWKWPVVALTWAALFPLVAVTFPFMVICGVLGCVLFEGVMNWAEK
jgi:hypothetical protein